MLVKKLTFQYIDLQQLKNNVGKEKLTFQCIDQQQLKKQ